MPVDILADLAISLRVLCFGCAITAIGGSDKLLSQNDNSSFFGLPSVSARPLQASPAYCRTPALGAMRQTDCAGLGCIACENYRVLIAACWWTLWGVLPVMACMQVIATLPNFWERSRARVRWVAFSGTKPPEVSGHLG